MNVVILLQILFLLYHTRNHTINYNVCLHSFVSITVYRLHTSPLTKVVFRWFGCNISLGYMWIRGILCLYEAEGSIFCWIDT